MTTRQNPRTIGKIKDYQLFKTEEPALEKPSWLKVKAPADRSRVLEVKSLLQSAGLDTVCQQADCPNLCDCFNRRRATFLIMGQICTRRCPFCNISHGYPNPLDSGEPQRLADAAKKLNLSYVVITSVDRDDLKDGGAQHFADCVNAIRRSSKAKVEILVPDFRGRHEAALSILAKSPPDVFNHNIETVPRLYKSARPGGDYEHSLNLLRSWSKLCPSIPSKSGIMVGLGETDEEVIKVLKDLRSCDVKMVTIGQYLAPSNYHIPVKRYVPPNTFKEYAKIALDLGFASCASGVLVRSSYDAMEQADNLLLNN